MISQLGNLVNRVNTALRLDRMISQLGNLANRVNTALRLDRMISQLGNLANRVNTALRLDRMISQLGNLANRVNTALRLDRMISVNRINTPSTDARSQDLPIEQLKPALANPQTYQLAKGCSPYNTSVPPEDFVRKINATFAHLRNQFSRGNKSFATADHIPIYAMAQCRDYLSKPDCVACFDAAVLVSRQCSIATGARVIFDGCFLRYEVNDFYNKITDDGNRQICGKRTAHNQDVFNTTAQQLLNELVLATPRIHGFFAAAKQEISGGGGATAYAVAQCIETITQTGCMECLAIAYSNIQNCLPKSGSGRAVDVGCFLRYSNKHIFTNNQTTNLAPFLGGGGRSGKKKAIIAGVAGGVGIILVLAALFLYQQSKKPKAARRGDILGATQLRGPENYGYKDLKTATKGFSEENKLGEGGFGDVYKGTLKNGDVVAVKKLVISSRAKADFDSEVRLITNVHHRNLIRLLGCSAKGEELLLVYEYMENASLDRYIYGGCS
nr:cysteine-rich receptor-like protein kinase 2 [Ipomoea batatas]